MALTRPTRHGRAERVRRDATAPERAATPRAARWRAAGWRAAGWRGAGVAVGAIAAAASLAAVATVAAGAALSAALVAAPARSAHAGQPPGPAPAHAVEAAIPGTPWVAVATEGDGEPRGVGSYALRVYAPAPGGGPRDRFVAGALRPRDGGIEAIRFADLDRDGTPELVVVLRSAGTGGHLSADAYRLRGGVPRFAASVDGLPADEEPMRALAAKLRPRGR
jgi:hypothetical protein